MIGDGTAQGLARSVFGDAVQRLVADASADEEDEEAAAIASCEPSRLGSKSLPAAFQPLMFSNTPRLPSSGPASTASQPGVARGDGGGGDGGGGEGGGGEGGGGDGGGEHGGGGEGCGGDGGGDGDVPYMYIKGTQHPRRGSNPRPLT